MANSVLRWAATSADLPLPKPFSGRLGEQDSLLLILVTNVDHHWRLYRDVQGHAVIPSALDGRIARAGALAQIRCERAIVVARWLLDFG
jgi:hypothetical protein